MSGKVDPAPEGEKGGRGTVSYQVGGRRKKQRFRKKESRIRPHLAGGRDQREIEVLIQTVRRKLSFSERKPRLEGVRNKGSARAFLRQPH